MVKCEMQEKKIFQFVSGKDLIKKRRFAYIRKMTKADFVLPAVGFYEECIKDTI
jgi:hypothetical protein